MDHFEDRILEEIFTERSAEASNPERAREDYIRGLKRALELYAGRERAEEVLAVNGESY